MLVSSLRLFNRYYYVKLLIIGRYLEILAALRRRITFIVFKFLKVRRVLAVWVGMRAHRRWRRKLMVLSRMWPVGCRSVMVGMWRARTEAIWWLRWWQRRRPSWEHVVVAWATKGLVIWGFKLLLWYLVLRYGDSGTIVSLLLKAVHISTVCKMLIVVGSVHRAVAAILDQVVPDSEVHLALLLRLSPLLDFTCLSMSRLFVLVLYLLMIRGSNLLLVMLIMTYLLEHMKVFVRILV